MKYEEDGSSDTGGKEKMEKAAYHLGGLSQHRVGKKENIQRIVDSPQEMQIVMKEIAGQIQSGDFSLSEESYQDLKRDYLALAITIVDIVDGAAYLFGTQKRN